MKRNYLAFFLIMFMTLSACGYKVVKNSKNINIQSITSTGDKRASYMIKNQLLLNSSNDGIHKINIILSTEKTKAAKEKNISGTVKKYYLNLKTDMIIKNDKDVIVLEKSFSTTNDFEVGKRNSETIILEKKKTENLIDQLAEQINTFLIIHYQNR